MVTEGVKTTVRRIVSADTAADLWLVPVTAWACAATLMIVGSLNYPSPLVQWGLGYIGVAAIGHFRWLLAAQDRRIAQLHKNEQTVRRIENEHVAGLVAQLGSGEPCEVTPIRIVK